MLFEAATGAVGPGLVVRWSSPECVRPTGWTLPALRR